MAIQAFLVQFEAEIQAELVEEDKRLAEAEESKLDLDDAKDEVVAPVAPVVSKELTQEECWDAPM